MPKITKLLNFKYGTIWQDPISGHRIGCLDASKKEDVEKLMNSKKASLAIQDPPYNVDINDEFGNLPLDQYINWSSKWIDNTISALNENASLYIWLGADIRDGLQPLPDFIIMMRGKPVKIRNFITMRNQRGYGTQKNWMAIRQELLYYIKGKPMFDVNAEYTDIPKKTRGYYKKVKGKVSAARLLHCRRTGEKGWGRTKVLKDGKILLSDKDLIGPAIFEKVKN